MMLVAYIPQMNRGSRCHVIPGARSLWIVTMKFSPVRIDDIPMRKIPKERVVTAAPDLRRVRRVEGPSRVHRGHQRPDDHEEPGDEDPVAGEVQPGERDVAGPDVQRDEEVPQPRGDRRDDEEEDHHRPVQGEEDVVGVVAEILRLRGEQLQPEQQGEDAADQEEDDRRPEVHRADPLVVEGERPGPPPAIRQVSPAVPFRFRPSDAFHPLTASLQRLQVLDDRVDVVRRHRSS